MIPTRPFALPQSVDFAAAASVGAAAGSNSALQNIVRFLFTGKVPIHEKNIIFTFFLSKTNSIANIGVNPFFVLGISTGITTTYMERYHVGAQVQWLLGHRQEARHSYQTLLPLALGQAAALAGFIPDIAVSETAPGRGDFVVSGTSME